MNRRTFLQTVGATIVLPTTTLFAKKEEKIKWIDQQLTPVLKTSEIMARRFDTIWTSVIEMLPPVGKSVVLIYGISPEYINELSCSHKHEYEINVGRLANIKQYNNSMDADNFDVVFKRDFFLYDKLRQTHNIISGQDQHHLHWDDNPTCKYLQWEKAHKNIYWTTTQKWTQVKISNCVPQMPEIRR